MGIIPESYLILMYNMKKFLQAISEELHQTDGQTHQTYSKGGQQMVLPVSYSSDTSNSNNIGNKVKCSGTAFKYSKIPIPLTITCVLNDDCGCTIGV